ncbi:hypothetical protein DM01DRAFT_1118513 [Hesseltinella vesiculosa]|uniref:Uncharacterized protein n=1 Tax=Hesseltinella vesiculosa TaxID=101127 RepID=A0A1X2GT99_9FUNG|nr:hypothetical protein DM01DRAFT_1118513 [Hesseltinella vesiculosa]
MSIIFDCWKNPITSVVHCRKNFTFYLSTTKCNYNCCVELSAFLHLNALAPTATITLMENIANLVALVPRWTRSRTIYPKGMLGRWTKGKRCATTLFP